MTIEPSASTGTTTAALLISKTWYSCSAPFGSTTMSRRSPHQGESYTRWDSRTPKGSKGAGFSGAVIESLPRPSRATARASLVRSPVHVPRVAGRGRRDGRSSSAVSARARPQASSIAPASSCWYAKTSLGRPHLENLRTASVRCFTPTIEPMLSTSPASPSQTATIGTRRPARLSMPASLSPAPATACKSPWMPSPVVRCS